MIPGGVTSGVAGGRAQWPPAGRPVQAAARARVSTR